MRINKIYTLSFSLQRIRQFVHHNNPLWILCYRSRIWLWALWIWTLCYLLPAAPISCSTVAPSPGAHSFMGRGPLPCWAAWSLPPRLPTWLSTLYSNSVCSSRAWLLLTGGNQWYIMACLASWLGRPTRILFSRRRNMAQSSSLYHKTRNGWSSKQCFG